MPSSPLWWSSSCSGLWSGPPFSLSAGNGLSQSNMGGSSPQLALCDLSSSGSWITMVGAIPLPVLQGWWCCWANRFCRVVTLCWAVLPWGSLGATERKEHSELAPNLPCYFKRGLRKLGNPPSSYEAAKLSLPARQQCLKLPGQVGQWQVGAQGSTSWMSCQ